MNTKTIAQSGLKYIAILTVAVAVIVIFSAMRAHQRQSQFNKIYYADLFNGLGACENVDLKDKKALHYCKTIEGIKTKIKVINDEWTVFYKLKEAVQDQINESRHNESTFNDTPYYLQKKHADLVSKQLQREENWFRISLFESCIDLQVYKSTYKALTERLTKCRNEMSEEMSKLRQKKEGLQQAINKYQDLDKSYQVDLEAEIEKHWSFKE